MKRFALAIMALLFLGAGVGSPAYALNDFEKAVRSVIQHSQSRDYEKYPSRRHHAPASDHGYLGACYPNLGKNGDPQDIGRAVQGVSVDEIDNILYFTGNRTSGQTEIFAMKWDANDPRKRVFLARSGLLWQVFSHQGTVVYRPSKNSRTLFFTGGNAAASSYVKDDKADLLRLKLVAWDYRNPKKTEVLRSWQLFDAKKYETSHLNVAITPDNRQIIARAKRKRDNVYVFRIWDVKRLLSMPEMENADAREAYAKTCVSAWGTKKKDGQSVAYDGKYIYLLSSNKALGPHSISIMDDRGNRVTETLKSTEGQEVYPQASRAEGEAIFFIHRHGRPVPVMAVYVQIPEPARKYCLFYDISRKNPALR